jgi:hypothetical protein
MLRTVLVLLCVLSAGIAAAQHEHHVYADTMETEHGAAMYSSFSLNLPMNRDGSGTSWLPDQSPMEMLMKTWNNTSVMFHGAVFARYTSQNAGYKNVRGGDKFDAPNWFMFVLRQKLSSKSLFSFHTMLSADRLTEGGKGYPLLFQTGESYNNIPLVDWQHPHDLVSELAVNFTRSFSRDIDLNAYFGYPGEPALGPPAFMHRPSAMNNPDAPLGHHWQDATHTTFGVGTLGLRYKDIKGEVSMFSGREPDENRYNFDEPKFDSYSYRLSGNPTANFALQFSQAFLKSPEALQPDIDVIRTTFSIIHTLQLAPEIVEATSLVLGMNRTPEKSLNSYLLESNLKFHEYAVYMRYEFIGKDVDELQLSGFEHPYIFKINALTIGVNGELFMAFETAFSFGMQGTINLIDKNLQTAYGYNPVAAEIYVKIAPAINRHH